MSCMYSLKIYPHRLYFKHPAGTSRGTYTTRDVWYIHLTSDEYPGKIGIGECAPLPGLSNDYPANYATMLEQICTEVAFRGHVDKDWLRAYPSILFGLETAFLHFNNDGYRFYDTVFSAGKQGININGLVWMNNYESMLQQIEDKINKGFRCIKLKIGAIDFNDEMKLIRHIRSHFSKNEIEIRVDANGAFETDEALEKLTQLAEQDIHSIEQPIRARQWEAMARLVEQSPLPIALDEELIGITDYSIKQTLQIGRAHV